MENDTSTHEVNQAKRKFNIDVKTSIIESQGENYLQVETKHITEKN